MYYSARDNGLIEQNAPGSRKVNTSTLHAVQYVESVPANKLFSFSVTDEVLNELEFISTDYIGRHIDRQMKSLEVLKQMIV